MELETDGWNNVTLQDQQVSYVKNALDLMPPRTRSSSSTDSTRRYGYYTLLKLVFVLLLIRICENLSFRVPDREKKKPHCSYRTPQTTSSSMRRSHLSSTTPRSFRPTVIVGGDDFQFRKAYCS